MPDVREFAEAFDRGLQMLDPVEKIERFTFRFSHAQTDQAIDQEPEHGHDRVRLSGRVIKAYRT